ncbi:uncharacterized protein DS421_4g111510 [Arachis hypogaea]|nr:uncharacterized protein DS421_4g111510 [Arachis hypogaea]
MRMMRTTCLVIIIILFFFCFAPLYSAFSCRESASLIIGENLPLTVDVESPTVRYMAISAINEYNNSWEHTVKLSLVKILGCRELCHDKRFGSYLFDLELLAKDEANSKTKKYLVQVYQRRINKNLLLHQKLIDFILVRSL